MRFGWPSSDARLDARFYEPAAGHIEIVVLTAAPAHFADEQFAHRVNDNDLLRKQLFCVCDADASARQVAGQHGAMHGLASRTRFARIDRCLNRAAEVRALELTCVVERAGRERPFVAWRRIDIALC